MTNVAGVVEVVNIVYEVIIVSCIIGSIGRSCVVCVNVLLALVVRVVLLQCVFAMMMLLSLLSIVLMLLVCCYAAIDSGGGVAARLLCYCFCCLSCC